MGASDSMFRDDVALTPEFRAPAEAAVQLDKTEVSDHTRHEMAVAVLLHEAQGIASGELVLPTPQEATVKEVIAEIEAIFDPIVEGIRADIDSIFENFIPSDSQPLE